MENIGKIFGKVLAGKKLASLSRGYLIQSIINKFLIKSNVDSEVKVAIRHNIVVVKTPNSFVGHLIFTQKQKLILEINLKLVNMKFEKIKDIKVVTF